jgi:hypothetical protein
MRQYLMRIGFGNLLAKRHGTKANRRDLEVAATQFNFLHGQ